MALKDLKHGDIILRKGDQAYNKWIICMYDGEVHYVCLDSQTHGLEKGTRRAFESDNDIVVGNLKEILDRVKEKYGI